MKEQPRFACTYSQGSAKGVEIWVDTVTGVNYVYMREGFTGGLSPLLDPDGKPVVTKVTEVSSKRKGEL